MRYFVCRADVAVAELCTYVYESESKDGDSEAGPNPDRCTCVQG